VVDIISEARVFLPEILVVVLNCRHLVKWSKTSGEQSMPTAQSRSSGQSNASLYTYDPLSKLLVLFP
jgi:hypothetical protein